MKLLKYFLLGVIILIVLFSSSCNSLSKKDSNQNQIITLKSTSISFPIQLLDESGKVISMRLKCLNVNNFTIDNDVENSSLVINIEDKVDIPSISSSLLAWGKVNFFETYTRDETIKYLEKISNSDCFHKLDELLGFSKNSSSSATFGIADVKDTSLINQYLKASVVKTVLPSDFRFMWSSQFTDDHKLELYTISNSNFTLNESSINSSSLDKTTDFVGVQIDFKENYWSQWESITKKNIDRQIAFVIDGKVYSAPMVRSAISSGKAEITGGFTESEARNLVAIISCGLLPLEFQVK